MKETEKQSLRYVVSDLVASTAAWLLFNLFRYREVVVDQGSFTSLTAFLTGDHVLLGQLTIPFFWVTLFYFSGYYNPSFGKSRVVELFSTLITVLIGVSLLFFGLVLNDLPHSFEIYYELFFFLLGIQFLLTYIPRLCITLWGLGRISRRKWRRWALMIGAGPRAAHLADDLYRLGYEMTGFIREDQTTPVAVAAARVAGLPEEIPAVMAACPAEELVVAIESKEDRQLLDILYRLYRYKCPIKVRIDQAGPLSQVKIKTIHGMPLVDVTANNFSEAEKNIKYVLDKACAVMALLLLSPLFAYIAWRVKRDSPGPVFFCQERIGYRGKPFLIYKFRTMYAGAEEEGPQLSHPQDARITPFGAFMRKYRLDELPQFWNVLKGDMSLVGPRPERRFYIDQIVKQAPVYYLLHNVRPGITSLGMVKFGYAGNVGEMVERLGYDLIYYENMSLAMDIKILLYTVKTVITGKGI